MAYCPHCGIELVNPFLQENNITGISPCGNGCTIEKAKGEINELLYCEALSRLDLDSGYNLYRAYCMPREVDMRYLSTDSSELPFEELRRLIQSMAEYLIAGDIKSADGVLERIPRTSNGLRSEVSRLRELDSMAFYNNTRPFKPWDSVVSMSDLSEGGGNGDNSGGQIRNKWFDVDEADDDFDEPMVEETHYRGSDIKIIGEYHNSYDMLDRIKSEIKGCQLVLVEAGPNNEFTPEYAVGSHAAEEYRDLLGVDVVRVLEGRSDAEPPDLSDIDSMNVKERSESLLEARGESPESFDDFITERDMKFALDAVGHIEEYARKNSYPAKVAILVGKNHVPGVYEFFGDF